MIRKISLIFGVLKKELILKKNIVIKWIKWFLLEDINIRKVMVRIN